MELETLKALGLSVEDLEKKIIEKAVAELTQSIDLDGFNDDSPIAKKINLNVKQFIDAKVNAIAEEHILPRVNELVQGTVLQATNEWGEKRGAPVTFIEYMMSRANDYISEKVSSDGRAKGETNGFSWNGTQTRITWLIHNHLHYRIDTAIKQSLTGANKVFADALAETCKLKLNEAVRALNITVKTK